MALFSGVLHVLGMPKSVGAIYGLLFASPEPLCFTQITERLGASKGSVSQGLTFLRHGGAVKVVEIADDRREFFEPELALRQLAGGFLQGRVKPLATETRAALGRLRQQAAASDKVHAKFRSGRIKQLETWNRQLARVLPLVQLTLSLSRK